MRRIRWEVQLAGTAVDLDDLCRVFTDETLRLEGRKNGYFLTSTEFTSLDSHREVEARASELVAILSGASRLSLGSRTPIHTSGVTCIDDAGKRHISMTISETIHVSARASFEVKHGDGSVTRLLPACASPGWMAVALDNPSVAKALRLFGADSESWIDAYRIFEVIADDVGGVKAIVDRRWATKAKISNFRHTANSVSASGDAARHGSENTDPPKHPMTLGEARSLVSVILHSWLQEKMER